MPKILFKMLGVELYATAEASVAVNSDAGNFIISLSHNILIMSCYYTEILLFSSKSLQEIQSMFYCM